MTLELFPDLPEDLSPKLAWLKQHGLETFEWDDEGRGSWACWKKKDNNDVRHNYEVGEGETELDATIDYSKKAGILHFTLKTYNQ